MKGEWKMRGKTINLFSALVMVACLSLLFGAGCPHNNKLKSTLTPSALKPEASNQLYVNLKYKFAVNYPQGWDVMKSYKKSVVIFKGPLIDNIYYVNTDIRIEQLKDEITLDEFVCLIECRHKKNIKDYYKVEEHNIIISGLPAISIVATSTLESRGKTIPIKSKITILIKGNLAFRIYCHSSVELYDQYVKHFNTVIKSLCFD